MLETAVLAVDFSADADLITFLKAIPDCRYRRGVRYPQWYLLLVAVLGQGPLEVCPNRARAGGAVVVSWQGHASERCLPNPQQTLPLQAI